MKTNKFWSIFAMLVMVFGTMVCLSCGDDDKEDDLAGGDEKEYGQYKPNLVSSWIGAIEFTEDGETYTFKATLEIKADGTYVEHSLDEGFRDFSGQWKDNGDGTITLTNFFDPTFQYALEGYDLFLRGKNWRANFTRK